MELEMHLGVRDNGGGNRKKTTIQQLENNFVELSRGGDSSHGDSSERAGSEL